MKKTIHYIFIILIIIYNTNMVYSQTYTQNSDDEEDIIRYEEQGFSLKSSSNVINSLGKPIGIKEVYVEDCIITLLDNSLWFTNDNDLSNWLPLMEVIISPTNENGCFNMKNLDLNKFITVAPITVKKNTPTVSKEENSYKSKHSDRNSVFITNKINSTPNNSEKSKPSRAQTYRIQKLLIDRGYSVKPTTIFDEQTKLAINSFIKEKALNIKCEISDELEAALRIKATINVNYSYNMTASNIKEGRKLLKLLGYQVCQTGIFSNEDIKYLKQFAKDSQLKIDYEYTSFTLKNIRFCIDNKNRIQIEQKIEQPHNFISNQSENINNLPSPSLTQKIQKGLKMLQFDVDVNGQKDAKTIKAIKDFQKKYGFKRDTEICEYLYDTIMYQINKYHIRY